MATNNDYLSDIAGEARGSGKTNNQLLKDISENGGGGGDAPVIDSNSVAARQGDGPGPIDTSLKFSTSAEEPYTLALRNFRNAIVTVEPESDNEAATKKYVDDNAGGGPSLPANSVPANDGGGGDPGPANTSLAFSTSPDPYSLPLRSFGGQVRTGTPSGENDAVDLATLNIRIPEPPETGTYILTATNGSISWESA